MRADFVRSQLWCSQLSEANSNFWLGCPWTNWVNMCISVSWMTGGANMCSPSTQGVRTYTCLHSNVGETHRTCFKSKWELFPFQLILRILWGSHVPAHVEMKEYVCFHSLVLPGFLPSSVTPYLLNQTSPNVGQYRNTICCFLKFAQFLLTSAYTVCFAAATDKFWSEEHTSVMRKAIRPFT